MSTEATQGETFGVTSMVTPLRAVMMRRPGSAMMNADPQVWNYARPLDPGELAAEYDAFAALVGESGAEIAWLPDAEDGLADSVFTFDPSFMVGDGAILLRPGKALRAAEVDLHRRAYQELGIPVIGEIAASGHAEGGDMMWLDAETLVVGRGFRTNDAGIDQLRSLLATRGVEVEVYDLPVWHGEAACMHLLSLISPLDVDLALVYRPLLPVALYERLRDRGMQLIEAPDAEFHASMGLNLNVLATAPRTCIALEGFPQTAGRMRDAGCTLDLFAGDTLCVACEGGPTCLTRPLLRDPGRAT